MKSTKLIVALLAALAMTVFVNARAAFSQDAGDPGVGVDASSDSTGPAIDEDAASADKVLELPQVTSASDGAPDTSGSPDADANDDSQAINAPSPGAPPPALDDDTANSGTADDDWGTVNDYQNQQVSAAPYMAYSYPTTVATTAVPETMNRPQVPASAYVAMSSPITQAARPPLNPGPWMLSPSMSMYSRPAGNAMMPMMSAPAYAFHH